MRQLHWWLTGMWGGGFGTCWWVSLVPRIGGGGEYLFKYSTWCGQFLEGFNSEIWLRVLYPNWHFPRVFKGDVQGSNHVWVSEFGCFGTNDRERGRVPIKYWHKSKAISLEYSFNLLLLHWTLTTCHAVPLVSLESIIKHLILFLLKNKYDCCLFLEKVIRKDMFSWWYIRMIIFW